MAAKTEKTVNYTDAQTAELVEAYKAVADKPETDRKAVVEMFAKKFGKTSRSIVAKLSVEKVYKPKEYTTKTGEAVQKKDEWADAIGKIVPNLTEGELESLTKANKTALRKIFETLAASKPIAE